MTFPIDTNEPTIVLNEDVVESGAFPLREGGASDGLPIGTIRIFAGDTSSTENGIAGDEQPARGQSLTVTQQEALFTLLGTTFGGNGLQTFDLPNLAGSVMVGTGNGPVGPEDGVVLGETYGQDLVTLSEANMPSAFISGQPYDNDQPSLGVNYLINTSGNFAGAGVNALGMVVPFVGNFAPAGYALATGQILEISQFSALYDVIGNTYGGNASQGTFALPNLEGRAVIGADNANGNSSPTEPLGTARGSDTTTLTSANLPYPIGSGQSIDNQQPTLALYYIVDVNAPGSAIFPTSGALGTDTPYFGEIMAYAGVASTIPTGWVVAAGQTLSITSNLDLFASIGITYGGNGENTFDLPDLEDKVVAGTTTGQSDTLGETYGTSSYSLTTDELPPDQAPSVTLGSAVYSTPEQQSLDLSNTGISVADPDGGNGVETLTVRVSEGMLQATSDGDVTVTSGDGTSDLVLSGTISGLNFFLGSNSFDDLTFVDNTNKPATVALAFSLNDNGYTGSGGPHSSPIETAVIDVTPCYCPGTLIETARGEERIETLRIGDRVRTKSGTERPIKWIGRRSYDGRFITERKDILPICIRAGALDGNTPRRDLWISPHHAMYLDEVLIEAKDLVNGASIVQAQSVDKVEYFHIELDTHDVIVAEGALSESFLDDDNRGTFHNAHEYERRYAGELPTPALYCAPRLEEGYQVEAVRRRIALRTGLLRAVDQPRSGPLRGYLDFVGESRIEGWAQNIDHPKAAVCLDMVLDGHRIGQIIANRHRADLERAGIGSGCHSFIFVLPQGIAPDSIEVRRSLDGSVLSKPAGSLRVG